ncbi:UNVERIFIED_CONTAM: hypothetical protein Sradi_2900000 [Sesamum radiatum]|uniref:DUF4218 domain-containing protein n=1 Tax=Sesamum radiatum TaxID=300843 RepID=A0AAW2RYU2_SESRA
MELSPKPMPLSEIELLQQLENVHTEYRKEDLKRRLETKGDKRKVKKRKLDESAETFWKKRSILFDLPYWSGNLVRHNLDVMHIEKNVCENVLFTLLGVKGKTKDNINARKDLQVMNIRSSLHPIPRPSGEEALLAGPVQFRWMYPIERYLSTLKRYVRNRAHPEGSIARGYLMEECMNFCSRYLNDVETKENRPPRNNDGDNNVVGGYMEEQGVSLIKIHCFKIHRYVLSNIDLVAPYREIHYATIKREKPRATPREIQHIHSQTFNVWFKSYLMAPFNMQRHACIVGGCRYRVKSKDIDKKTQCSGVVVNADTLSFASAKDLNPRCGTVSYYGVLKDILEIQYTKDTQFLMFECDWVDNEKGLKQDEFKFTLVNFNHLMYNKNLPTDEPFVLASQVQQVWYIPDPSEVDWNVVVTMTRRDNYDVYSTIEAEPHSRVQLDDNIPIRNEDVCLGEGRGRRNIC